MTYRGDDVRAPPPRSEPAINMPPLTLALIVLNLAIHGVLQLLPARVEVEVVMRFAMTPARYFDGPPGDTLSLILGPFISMFLHADWIHVGMNMATLAAYGSPLERLLGRWRFIAFYIVTGLAGDVLHAALHATSDIPTIGASGAISGLFGGLVIVMQAGGRLRSIVPLVIVYLVSQVGFGLVYTTPNGGGIAWAAHVGGFFAGMALIWPFMRGRLPSVRDWR